jgi:CYTH domain-containing protein
MATALEIERKFLLKRKPSIEEDDVLKITQHYCKKDGIEFRIRKTATYKGFQLNHLYHKTIKKFISDGIYEETENIISKEEYENYKKDFAGTSITKTRYIYKFGDLKWEVDVFDFGLVVAEIELPSMEHPLELPGYIAKELIMEVTKHREFTNKNLAEIVQEH